MFSMTVQGETLAELADRLQAAADSLGAADPTQRGDAASGTGPKNASHSTAGAGSPSGSPGRTATKDASPSEADGEEMVYATDVQPHIVKLSKVHGREAAVDILGEFEDEDGNACASGKTVQPADWPALVKKVQARQKKLDKAKAAAAEDE